MKNLVYYFYLTSFVAYYINSNDDIFIDVVINIIAIVGQKKTGHTRRASVTITLNEQWKETVALR